MKKFLSESRASACPFDACRSGFEPPGPWVFPEGFSFPMSNAYNTRPPVIPQEEPDLTDNVTPKVEALKDMVEYQEGAVVSRTIMEKPKGTVTLFAFAEGEGLSEHTTPYDALVQVLDGEVEITIGGESFNLDEGEMIIMPADVPHALRALGRFKMLLVMVKN